MPKFRVKSPIEHDGKRYEVGSTIELNEEQAKACVECVDLIGKKEAEKDAAERARIEQEVRDQLKQEQQEAAKTAAGKAA